jgi:hypothetical protein
MICYLIEKLKMATIQELTRFHFQKLKKNLKVLDVIDWTDDFKIISIQAFDGTLR